jgi:Ca-activated chloride channel family protein
LKQVGGVQVRTLIPAALALVLAATLFEAPASGAGEPQDVTFRGGVDLVTATVSVRDRKGRVIKNLKQADFEIIDSGTVREIRTFESGEAPISLAVLLDISGSMAVGGNIERARHAVNVAMTTLQGTDEAALFTFDSQLKEVVPFTSDLERVKRLSLQGTPWGQTSLYDAVAETARRAAGRTNRHRAVFVITDGVDTGSHLTAPEVSGIASSIDVPVYLLTVVNPVDHPGGDFGVIQTDGKSAQTASLADLARWTGGDMRIASIPEHTAAAVIDLFAELRHQYLISFEPGEREGWHPIEIRARKNDLIVRARSGYMAGRLRPAEERESRRP